MELRGIIERLFLLYSIDDVKEYLSHVEGIIYKIIKLPHKEKWDVYIWKEEK